MRIYVLAAGLLVGGCLAPATTVPAPSASPSAFAAPAAIGPTQPTSRLATPEPEPSGQPIFFQYLWTGDLHHLDRPVMVVLRSEAETNAFYDAHPPVRDSAPWVNGRAPGNPFYGKEDAPVVLVALPDVPNGTGLSIDRVDDYPDRVVVRAAMWAPPEGAVVRSGVGRQVVAVTLHQRVDKPVSFAPIPTRPITAQTGRTVSEEPAGVVRVEAPAEAVTGEPFNLKVWADVPGDCPLWNGPGYIRLKPSAAGFDVVVEATYLVTDYSYRTDGIPTTRLSCTGHANGTALYEVPFTPKAPGTYTFLAPKATRFRNDEYGTLTPVEPQTRLKVDVVEFSHVVQQVI